MFVAERVELPASTAQPLVTIAFDKEPFSKWRPR
jgi:hypothetical protein